MSKEWDEFRKDFGRVPWITRRGLDLTKFPIDSILKRALGESEEEFRGALSILATMHLAGRQEAGIFLLGLLAHSGDDWKRREEIVKRLEGFNTRRCANFLLGELKRVKSSNTTRRYLAAVLKVFGAMPLKFIQSGLLELAADASLSQRMKDKFLDMLDNASRREKGFR